MKYFLETLSEGCPKNLLESANYRILLEDSGFQLVENIKDADVIVLNTCGCLESLQQKAKNAIDKSIENKKDESTKIVVAGCYPYIDKENSLKLKRISHFEPGNLNQLKEILNSNSKLLFKDLEISKEDFRTQPSFVKKPSKFLTVLRYLEKKTKFRIQPIHNFLKSIMMSTEFYYISLGKGCLGNCTFCGIKLAIGNPVSRDAQSIVNEIARKSLQGEKNFWLVADDVGCWGTDLNTNPVELFKMINTIPSRMNIVINYFEPEMFLKYIEEMLEIVKDGRYIQICLPIQTGSAVVLRRMGRHYDLEEIYVGIRKLRLVNRNLIIKTQIIISFPGETWVDFVKTLWAMRLFDGVGVNAYARLKFTSAYKLVPNPGWVTSIRFNLAKIFAAIFIFLFMAKSVAAIKRD